MNTTSLPLQQLFDSTRWRLLLRLALRNLLRHLSRTSMTLAAIAFGVTALIVSGGFIEDTIIETGESLIHSQSGHIQIAKKGYFDFGTREPEKYLWSDQALVARIQTLSEVADVMTRVTIAGLLNNGRTDLTVIAEGIEANKEAKLNSYLQLSAGRMLNDTDTFGALLGHGVAKALGVKPGDSVTLLANTAGGALNTVELKIVGVFQTYAKEYDAHAIRIPLGAAQELLNAAGGHQLVVSLKQTAQTHIAAQKIQAMIHAHSLELKTWRELNDFYDSTVELYAQQFGMLQLIILGMVLLSVANTINMNVFERIGEFGTLRALGDRRREIVELLMLENVLLGLIGACMGLILGVLAARGINMIGIPMPPPPNADLGYTSYIRLNFSLCVHAWLIGLCATIIAGIWPAMRVSKIPIVEALRKL